MSNIYVYEQGSIITINENRLIITKVNKEIESIPIELIDGVMIFGNIQVSTQSIHKLLSKGINITYLSKKGYNFGRLENSNKVNIERQRLQFKKSEDIFYSLEISKKFIEGKIRNQRTVLLRVNKQLKNKEIKEKIELMKRYIAKIEYVDDIESLMGMEGFCAKIYFDSLNYILNEEYRFKNRSKRPPRDPFNSIISFGYALLYNEVFNILGSKGLNPYVAFLHKDRNKHAALCSDIMEEFRPILIDTLSIYLLNNDKIIKEDFIFNVKNNSVLLNKDGVSKVVSEFEKRILQKVSYVKEINYKMNFREIIEYQISLLINSLMQDNPKIYKPVLIR